MIKKLGGSKGFLIDGYPREVAQGEEFEKAIAPCKHILYFEVSDETMTQRLLKRAETSRRADDNVETIKKRLVPFHQHSEPVIAAYKAKCSVIPAERAIDEIFADITAAALDEGSWSQHPPWCCRCWCTRWIRQIQGIIHCLQIGLIYLVRYIHSLQSLFHADIDIILSVH